MRHFKIAAIAGDGVGPEVVAEALRVLDRTASVYPDADFELDPLPWGSEHYLTHGEMMPSDALDRLAGYDALLLGAIGSPSVPDHVTLREMLLVVRTGFDQYVNLRPIRLLPGISSPLAQTVGGIDMTFVREGTEGEYAGLGGRQFTGTRRELALQTSLFTRVGIERVVEWAFAMAERTGASVTSISKGNALQHSGVLWDEVFAEVAARHASVRTASYLVDAAAMLMVRDPGRFEIVVTSNLFGDILTDLGAALVGGLGLVPSATLDPEGRFPSTFEPVHGSAPDIAGKGVANPIGMIWSVALMLEHLGLRDQHAAVMRAIERVTVAGKVRTPDLGGDAPTSEVGQAIAAEITPG